MTIKHRDANKHRYAKAAMEHPVKGISDPSSLRCTGIKGLRLDKESASSLDRRLFMADSYKFIKSTCTTAKPPETKQGARTPREDVQALLEFWLVSHCIHQPVEIHELRRDQELELDVAFCVSTKDWYADRHHDLYRALFELEDDQTTITPRAQPLKQARVD